MTDDLIRGMEREVRAHPDEYPALAPVLLRQTLAKCLPMIDEALAEAQHHLADNVTMRHTPGIVQWSQERDRLAELAAEVREHLAPEVPQ